jgi:hypothetical protein
MGVKIDDSFGGRDGDELLTRVRDWLGTYISTVSDSDLDLLVLWAVHTHLVMETYTTPRLQIDSPVPGSGKTTVIEHLNRLCKRAVQMATISSPAMLARMLDKEIRTILIDEADRALDPRKDGMADTLAVINSGYKRGGTRPVSVPVKGGGWDVKEMPTFSPVALAGNNPTLPDDTRSRIIRVLLMPDHSELIEESNWREIDDEARALHDEIAAWADQVRDQVEQGRPDLPDGITGRFREKWAPLKQVADAAGGEWPKRTDAMALSDKEEWEMDREDGLLREAPAVALLRHIQEVWPANQDRTANATFLPSEELTKHLIYEYPEMWGPMSPYGKALTTKRLGSMLAKAYKIHSDQPVRGGPRGYHYASFVRPWHRMGIAPPTSDASDASNASDAPGSSDSSSASAASDTQGGAGPSDAGSSAPSDGAGWTTCSCGQRFFATGWPDDLCKSCKEGTTA